MTRNDSQRLGKSGAVRDLSAEAGPQQGEEKSVLEAKAIETEHAPALNLLCSFEILSAKAS